MPRVERIDGLDGLVELAASSSELGMLVDSVPNEVVAAEWHRSSSLNPAGKNVHLVIRDGGRIVASGSLTPKWFISDGGRCRVAEVGGMYTAPGMQGRGYFSAIVGTLTEIARSIGLQALYATPNARSGPVFLGKLGWLPVRPWIRWLRPTHPAPRALLNFASRVRRFDFVRASYSLEVGAPRFVTGIDDLDRKSKPHFERSAAQFAWRYPEPKYQMVSAFAGGEIVGWCVVARTHRLGRNATAIADFGIKDKSPALSRSLLSAASEVFRDVSFLFGGTFEGCHADLWKASCAVGRSTAMPLIALPLAGERVIDALRSMTFDLGDADTV